MKKYKIDVLNVITPIRIGSRLDRSFNSNNATMTFLSNGWVEVITKGHSKFKVLVSPANIASVRIVNDEK